MATLNIKKVNALPGVLTANTMYLVKGVGSELEIHISDSTGASARHVVTQSEITAQIANAVKGLNDVKVVADIVARDALTAQLTTDGDTQQVLVLDATGDATVTTGAATYIFDGALATWHKISEAESLDLSLTWESITGRPAATAAQIDAAVAAAHSHANLADLDKLTVVGGELMVEGQPVRAHLDSAEW